MKKIFFAYSDNAKDVELYKEFNKHFKTYARSGMLMIIDKDELFLVDNDNEKTLKFLDESDITVPLLSVDYLTNEQCLTLFESAVAGNKIIIPVLLRDCDYAGIDKMKGLESNLLPDDKESVTEHLIREGGHDEVFSAMAKKVKAIALKKELEVLTDFSEARKPKSFFYLLTGLLLLIGILAASFTHTQLHDWRITSLVFLLFLVIVLIAGNKMLFPTKIYKK